MKKILTLFTVLCMTLMFTGCTKTVKLEDIDSANFTEDILSIKCINTLEEMMSENFEPKFEVSNNYKEGDIPYLNFDFDKKEEVNEFFVSESLAIHANHTANDINIKKGFEDGYYFRDDMNFKVYSYDDKYLFINMTAIGGTSYSNFYSICIDKDDKKLLTKEDVLAIKDYDLNANKESLLDQILFFEVYDDEKDRDKLFDLIVKDLSDDYDYSPREYESNEVLIKAKNLNNGYCEDPFYETIHIPFPVSINDITLVYYINDNNELMAHVDCNLESDKQDGFDIKLCD